ncbi:VOC family protein [Enterococcus sp. AZ103]|uniref:VOC family protein n=1 Tax=Enterococcus sp. AZ103 TaxID=2774628 RepID=UPI003F24EB3B
MNRLNLICLGVNDMKESLSFYKNIGFKTYEKSDNPPIVFFDNQGTKLELYPLEQLTKDINPDSPPKFQTGIFPGITLAINMKTPEEVDAFFKEVHLAGGKIIKQPTKNPDWDGYSGYFTDPNGYYWEVAYGKIWQFDENNMLVIEE